MSVVKITPNTILAITLASAVATALYICPRRRRFLASKKQKAQLKFEQDLLDEEESAFLTNHTSYVSLNSHELRIIDIPHENEKTPLMVFIHGLGGQVANWENQLQHYSKTYHVLAMDLLGSGFSEITLGWEEYKTKSLVNDIIQLIQLYPVEKPLILVGHSYGCCLSTFTAASPKIHPRLKGMVLISPKAALGQDQLKGQKILSWVPDFVLDTSRLKDRQGGLYSKSVERLLGSNAPEHLRRKQLRWNLMSRTSVYKRIAVGAEFPSDSVYKQLGNLKILFIGGEKDEITPPKDMDIIQNKLIQDKTQMKPPHVIPNVGHMSLFVIPDTVNMFIDDFLLELD
ncbi:Alpha/Beta hydrolase protein [Cunninghamella echinulata]|nr:Alpha/Beta hydrolase protein [Cunninghamella echinulata]